VPLKTPKAVYSAGEQKYTVAGGDVQAPWGGIQSDRSRNKGIDTRIGKGNACLRGLYCSVVTKRELSEIEKLSVFKSVFVPILTFGHMSLK